MAFTSILFLFLALTGSYILLFTFLTIWRRLTSPIKNIPGPKSSSFIFGSLKEIWAQEPHAQAERWAEQYGHVVKYTALFGEDRLYIADTKALNHILLKHSYDYPKDDGYRWGLSRTTGHGILYVEGERHKQQRRLMNPAFGPSQLRELTEIFVQKSAELTEILDAECAQSLKGSKRVDVVSWINRTTLDVIGLAGFNYEFNSLKPNAPPNELNRAFSAIATRTPAATIVLVLKQALPFLRRIPILPHRDMTIWKADKTLTRISRGLLEETRTALLGSGEKGDGWAARDILSLLIRANLATEERLRMSDFEVMSQIATFVVAGHETSSTATSWALYSLSLNPEMQIKLRDELLQLENPMPTMEDLSSLTYLDWCVKETLRFHSPVAVVTRCASKDDIIPLSRPYTDVNGLVHDSVSVKRGQFLDIPILAINVDKGLWGDDAMEFRPERWDHTPEAISAIPGVWSNLLSFIGGPRACIGYRFSILEIKALLFFLIRSFEFSLAVPKEEIGRTRSLVGRTVVKTGSSSVRESSLPVLIRRYRPESESNEKILVSLAL